MGSVGRRIATILLFLLAAAAAVPGTARAGAIPVVGQLEIALCDGLACDVASIPDSRWKRVELTPEGLVEPLPHSKGLACVRLWFSLSNAAGFREPALLVTNPADAERVFLNGIPVGGGGTIAERFSTVPGPARVLRIPPGALREGPNLLTMKVLFAEKNVELFDGPLLIGEFDRLKLRAERLRTPAIGLEAAFLAMFGLIIAFYLFLILKGVVRSDYLLFTAFTSCYAVTFLLGSSLLHEIGLSGPAIEQLQAVLMPTTSLLMLALVTSATGASHGPVFWLFAAASAAFIVLNAALPPLTALYALAEPRQVYLALVGVYYLVVSAANVVRRRDDSVAILVGILAYAVGSRVEVFWGLQFRDYSMGIFVLCMLFALVSRHARMQNRLIRLSSSLLDAHEEERKRIARDIHDSVGQSLLALKLRLQMLSSSVSGGEGLPPGTLDGLVRDASAIIEEVRRTSMDLRPSFIESMSLVEAVSWYAGSFMERSGIELNVLGGENSFPDPPPRTRDNLYRALQEMLTNARKHSHATRIEISLFRSGSKLVLEVTDNGTGFDPSASTRPGIGLETIRERAELLGGSCRMRGAPGRGTTITLEVPLQ
jgi:signal transduction histidine kinase